MHTANVNGFHIAYQRAGSGPPLVLLHGALGDSRDWRRQIEGLQDSLTVVAWDAPGCGQSSDPPESFSSGDYADTLAEFIDSLDISAAHILGLSWGGGLALELYDRHPDSVASLILADTYAGWKGSLPEEEVQRRLDSCLRESEMAPEEFVPDWLPGLVTDAASEELRNEILETMSSFHPAGFRAMVRGFAELDLRPVLPRIAVPTLLIWGEEDRRSPLSNAETICDSIPGARLVVIPNAGHMSNMEQPERFNDEVRRFITSLENRHEQGRPRGITVRKHHADR